MRLPTANEINVFDSLDERSALEHFLGKSLDDAQALCEENSLHYQDDLMWMGPKAFCFYVAAAINYIQSLAATGDSGMVYCFEGLLRFRWEYDRDELADVAEELLRAIDYILDNWSKFDIDPDIDGDLAGKYRELRRTIEA